MIFRGAFTAPGDNDDVLDTGCDGLFDAVMNDRLVNKSQLFFGNHLGGGEESCAKAPGGENDFANFLCHYGSVSLGSIVRRTW